MPGDKTAHAVLWQNGTVTDLGTLSGDRFSVSGNINDAGQVPITSCTSVFSNKCRAAIWQNGVMTDLNTLVRLGSSLYLVGANSINNRGAIVGTALDRTTGSTVPFLATPCGLGSSGQCAKNALVKTNVKDPAEIVQHESVQLPRDRLSVARFREFTGTQP